MSPTTIRVPANFYRQFDADFSLEVPAESYGGWQKADVPIALDHTAIVVMHAWDCGTPEEYPGVHRPCEYLPRSYEICRNVFPRLLAAVRATGLPIFHVLQNGGDYNHHAGYRRAVELVGTPPAELERIKSDAVLDELRLFCDDNSWPGKHNREDRERRSAKLDMPVEARPQESEGMADTSEQLFALCKDAGVNHLIYAGFAIDGCLLMSPGGMIDMTRRGIMCSAFRQAVTAIENKETARTQTAKEIALWRVTIMHGLVFDVDDFIAALPT